MDVGHRHPMCFVAHVSSSFFESKPKPNSLAAHNFPPEFVSARNAINAVDVFVWAADEQYLYPWTPESEDQIFSSLSHVYVYVKTLYLCYTKSIHPMPQINTQDRTQASPCSHQ